MQIENVPPTDGTDDSTEEDTEAVRRAALRVERKENFSFAMVGIAIGEELHFVDDSAVCKVTNQKPPRVELNGKEMSLSAATTQVKQSR